MNMNTNSTTFDYIIVGAGAAGCVFVDTDRKLTTHTPKCRLKIDQGVQLAC